MTQPQDRDDLHALYERAADAPIVTGDHVHDQQVIGFALIRESVTDQMLVEGEQDLGNPRTVRYPALASPRESRARVLHPCMTLPRLYCTTQNTSVSPSSKNSYRSAKAASSFAPCWKSSPR